MPAPAFSTALLVGASRGLGLGLARAYLDGGWRVIATARANDAALRALARDRRLTVEHVDIADATAVAALRGRLAGEEFDLVFIVAGISGPTEPPIHEVAPETVAHVYLANAYHPARFAEAVADRVRPGGSVAFMSSFLGSIASNDDAGWETYRASKAAQNMMARSFSVRHPGLAVLSVSPGWVRTDMGGPEADLDIDTSVRGVVQAIAARRGRPGHAYVHYDGRELPW